VCAVLHLCVPMYRMLMAFCRCLCKAELCYQCGKAWKPKTCECPQWQERFLYDQAARVAARGQPRGGRANAAEIERAAAALLANHDCAHNTGFERNEIAEPVRCDLCQLYMRDFIMACRARGCGLRVCLWCRHNRLPAGPERRHRWD